ncbi:MAG: FAD-dependent oxidoreductase [Schaedlerella sp.]|nr:FAD-dependent oxidoreductase [Schaedlerella sp.]
MRIYDIVIVGGGPAGLAAAVSAKENGIDSILILERDKELGGILNQCIHNGFGLHTFKEELTGPEYADRFIKKIQKMNIEYMLNTMVIDISKDKIVTAMNREEGLFEIQAKAIILAMGCRERPRGALNIPGYRPAGIFSAGTAQRLVNIEGYLPGREVVILGSGDIGLIMARRMTLEGAKVKVVAELMPYSGGLKRNIVQCLDDFGIPLKLSHTVVDIDGKERVKGITLAKVDNRNKPIPGTEEYIPCDTLLLSCGLIPENELSRELGVDMETVTNGPVVNESFETSIEGVYACGNVLHVHDLVDFVSEEAAMAGKNAVYYIQGRTVSEFTKIEIVPADGVRYTVPQYIRMENMRESLTVRYRVGAVYKNCCISIYFDDERVMRKKRPVLTPGEMEGIKLFKTKLQEYPDLKKITVRIEEA